MSTIEDVAKAAGVSSTTVSHVLNGTRRVSDELRGRVEAAASELGYRPNGLARALRMRRSRTIGLVIPDNSNFYFAETARVIEDLGFKSGYSVILCNTNDDVDRESSYVDVLLDHQVDGIVFISAGDSSANLKKCVDSGTPIVVADRELPGSQVDVALVDNRAGGRMATRHLIDLGHRRIACISGPSSLLPSVQRVDGYRQAMEEAGLRVPDGSPAVGDFHFASGESCANRLLSGTSPRPTALFVCNDVMAIGVLRTAHRLGLRVPEDLSLVGFDNIPMADALMPALTTVAQPVPELAHAAVAMLIARISARCDGRPAPPTDRVILSPNLVMRDSTAPPLAGPEALGDIKFEDKGE